MDKPTILDLFCGAGGCARGYHDAGFEVVGVDINPQPRYPYRFIQADALDYLDTADLSSIDAIHASPPCQHYTMMLNHGMGDRSKHPDLVDIVRQRLLATGKPYVIENVPGAPVEKAIMLCGAMFGLRVYRHRHFESNIFLFQPGHPKHMVRAVHAGMIPHNGEFYSPVGHLADKNGSQAAMGINWMKTQHEIAQAIPPAYTAWIGQFLMMHIEAERQVSHAC